MTGSDPAHDFPAVCTVSRISHGWSVGTINSADMASDPLSLSHLLAPIIPGCLHYLEPTTQPPPSLTSVRTLLSLGNSCFLLPCLDHISLPWICRISSSSKSISLPLSTQALSLCENNVVQGGLPDWELSGS